MILKSVFHLIDNQKKEIEDIFNKDAELIKGKDAYYLQKGKYTISLKYIQFLTRIKIFLIYLLYIMNYFRFY